jgi:hypothetical protein
MRPVSAVAAAALVLASTSVAQQPPPSALDWVSLLDQRYYPNTGGFLLDGLVLALPPAGATAVELVFARGGQTVVTVPLQIQPFSDLPAFANLRGGGPTQLGEQPGDYTVSLRVGGQALTEMAFTITLVQGGDTYNPTRTLSRDGPWRTLAFIAVPAQAPPSTALRFYWWAADRELPNQTQGRVTVRMKRGTQEVAAARPTFVSAPDWRQYSVDLRAGNANLTLAGLGDGAYTVTLEGENGQVFRSFPVTVSGGQIAPHPRSLPTATPRTAHMPPRAVFVDRNGRATLMAVYWLEAATR